MNASKRNLTGKIVDKLKDKKKKVEKNVKLKRNETLDKYKTNLVAKEHTQTYEIEKLYCL